MTKKPATFSKRRKFTPRRSITPKTNLKKDIFAFKRRYYDGTITGSPAYAPYLEGKSVRFNLLPGFSDFANLFDRYMITYAKVYYHLKVDPSAQSSAIATWPKLFYIRDYDDTFAPSSINELREHQKCTYRVMNPNKPVVFGFKPSTLSETYRSPIATSYSPQWAKWIDMATTDVNHFGWKIAIDDLTNTNYKVDVEVVLWFKCKDTR